MRTTRRARSPGRRTAQPRSPRGTAWPSRPALEIQLIGGGVFRRAGREPLLVFTSQTQAQVVRDRFRDIRLHGQHVGERPIELLAPELRDSCDVDQLGLHREPIAALRDAAGDDGARVQRHPGVVRIHVLVSVPRGKRPRDDAEPVNPREIVGQRVGDAVAQIVRVGRAARVDEGQDGNGIDWAAGRPRRAPPGRRAECDQQDNAGRASQTDATRRGKADPRPDRRARRFVANSCEISAQIGRRLVSPIAIFLQRPADDVSRAAGIRGFSVRGAIGVLLRIASKMTAGVAKRPASPSPSRRTAPNEKMSARWSVSSPRAAPAPCRRWSRRGAGAGEPSVQQRRDVRTRVGWLRRSGFREAEIKDLA